METINERMQFVADEMFNSNISLFEKVCGLKPATLKHVVKGRLSKPSYEVIESICRTIVQLNIDWLIVGKGEMLKQLETIDENIDLVYHYTKMTSFKSILSSNELRLSQISKSNDKKEKKISDEMNLFGREYKELKYLSLTFGESGDKNPMLWHFYGEDHSGVCLCFNKNKMLNILKDGVVTYKVDINNDQYNQEDWMFIKTSEWLGEKEYRILFTNDSPQFFDQCVESISFGYDTSIGDIIDIINHSSIMMTLYANRKISKIQISSNGHMHSNEIHNIPQCVSLIKESGVPMVYSFDDINQTSIKEIETELVALRAENRALREVIGLGERKESGTKSA